MVAPALPATMTVRLLDRPHPTVPALAPLTVRSSAMERANSAFVTSVRSFGKMSRQVLLVRTAASPSALAVFIDVLAILMVTAFERTGSN